MVIVRLDMLATHDAIFVEALWVFYKYLRVLSRQRKKIGRYTIAMGTEKEHLIFFLSYFLLSNAALKKRSVREHLPSFVVQKETIKTSGHVMYSWHYLNKFTAALKWLIGVSLSVNDDVCLVGGA